MKRGDSISVRERMSRTVVSVGPDATLATAATTMRDRKIRHLPVVDGHGHLVGIVTARDLRQALFAPAVESEDADLRSMLDALRVGDVMTRTVVSVAATASIRDAARVMYERRLGALPVIDGGRLVGIVSETDVLQVFQDLLGDAMPAAISV